MQVWIEIIFTSWVQNCAMKMGKKNAFSVKNTQNSKMENKNKSGVSFSILFLHIVFGQIYNWYWQSKNKGSSFII